MFNLQMELMLNGYYEACVALGDLLCDREITFNALCDICLIAKDERKELFEKAESKEISSINSEGEYNLHCRVSKFVGKNSPLDEIIGVKGRAISELSEIGFNVGTQNSVISLRKEITNLAEIGKIPAMRLWAFLQAEGILTPKDLKGAQINIDRISRWGDVFGILMALYYGDARGADMAKLKYALELLPDDGLYKKAVRKYGKPDDADLSDRALLEKLFCAEVIKRDSYSRLYSRIIYNGVLGVRDKERLAFSPKEVLQEVGDLPVKLSASAINLSRSRKLVGMPISRKEELEKICASLYNSDLRSRDNYRPLCICCNSPYVLRLYADAIAKWAEGAHVERIDASTLTDYDFAPSKSNIFVRSCDEDSENIYLIFMTNGDATLRLSGIIPFIKGGGRRQFRLNNPAICLDLSNILPICLCTPENARHLKGICDVVDVSSVSSEEKEQVFDYMLKSMASDYCIPSATLSEEAKTLLMAQTADNAERILDGTVLANRVRGSKLVLTKSQLQQAMSANVNKVSLGFGGNYNGI